MQRYGKAKINRENKNKILRKKLKFLTVYMMLILCLFF